MEPFSQCQRGHFGCSRCRAGFASCPVCHTNFSTTDCAMDRLARMILSSCREGCGRELQLRPLEAGGAARTYEYYHCPTLACGDKQPLSHRALRHHIQSAHESTLRCGQHNTFSLKVNSAQEVDWIINAHFEYFFLRADVDVCTWGVIMYVAYIGPPSNAKHYSYEITLDDEIESRRMVYSRNTHGFFEGYPVKLDCFHLNGHQSRLFTRYKRVHSGTDKFFDFNVSITKCDDVTEPGEESDS